MLAGFPMQVSLKHFYPLANRSGPLGFVVAYLGAFVETGVLDWHAAVRGDRVSVRLDEGGLELRSDQHGNRVPRQPTVHLRAGQRRFRCVRRAADGTDEKEQKLRRLQETSRGERRRALQKGRLSFKRVSSSEQKQKTVNVVHPLNKTYLINPIY